MDTKSYDHKKFCTIREALEITGYHNAHFRMHILKTGKVAYVKEMIPGTNIPRILVERKSLEAYMKTHGAIDGDGRKRNAIYLSSDEKAAVEKLLAELRK